MVLGNLLFAILMRNELFGRILYFLVNSLFAKVQFFLTSHRIIFNALTFYLVDTSMVEIGLHIRLTGDCLFKKFNTYGLWSYFVAPRWNSQWMRSFWMPLACFESSRHIPESPCKPRRYLSDGCGHECCCSY